METVIQLIATATPATEEHLAECRTIEEMVLVAALASRGYHLDQIDEIIADYRRIMIYVMVGET